MDEKKKEPNRILRKYILWSSIVGVLTVLSSAFFVLSIWYINVFNVEFKELIYTLLSPLKGTSSSMVSQILWTCLPWVFLVVALYVVGAVCFYRFFYCRKPRGKLIRRIAVSASALLLVISMVATVFSFRIPAYIAACLDSTTIYEDYYVDPNDVLITANGKTKNLIYIYVESLETTYASVADGGMQEVNYMPRLTQLAKENINFTENADGTLGGFHNPVGTGWTIAALMATTAGIPFSFPLSDSDNWGNEMDDRQVFASGLTTLGDILEEKGYRQEFLCGSDAAFAGRDMYFKQHGNYALFDLFTAREEGYIPEDYFEFWGYEDAILFDIARDELTKLASKEGPFNFTMLTVDLHHIGGYVCNECGSSYENPTANVVDCNDRQVTEFVQWCMAQDFYEDSVIVITGDHPRMDQILVEGVNSIDRTMYNCFINSAVEPLGGVNGREFTCMDIFPTTLAAMGFEIEGNRLGLGVNLFSDQPTLTETMGFWPLNEEVGKYSDYYIQKFS